MNKVTNQIPFLRTSREFPEDLKQLTVELTKSYIDTSLVVNDRTIGIFSTNRPSINGEKWFLKQNKKQQGLRQVYKFTSFADIPIGFKIKTISEFTRCWGVYTNSSKTAWFGINFGTSVLVAGQVFFYIDTDASPNTDLIKFVQNGTQPAISEGKIILEWVSET